MAKKKQRLTPCGGIKLYCSTICLETAHPRKARSGKFSPLYNGRKRVNIKGLKKGGKIYVEMPKDAVLVIRQQTKKRGKK